MEYQAKLNEKYTPTVHCISSTSYKKFISFISYCFTSSFTSVDNFLQTFSELYSKTLLRISFFFYSFDFFVDDL